MDFLILLALAIVSGVALNLYEENRRLKAKLCVTVTAIGYTAPEGMRYGVTEGSENGAFRFGSSKLPSHIPNTVEKY